MLSALQTGLYSFLRGIREGEDGEEPKPSTPRPKLSFAGEGDNGLPPVRPVKPEPNYKLTFSGPEGDDDDGPEPKLMFAGSLPADAGRRLSVLG